MSKREEWMLEPGEGERDPLSGLFSSQKKGPTSAAMKRPPVRELNPYLRDGGTGLPPGAELFTRPPSSRERVSDVYNVNATSTHDDDSYGGAGSDRRHGRMARSRSPRQGERKDDKSRSNAHQRRSPSPKAFPATPSSSSSSVDRDGRRNAILRQYHEQEKIEEHCPWCQVGEHHNADLIIAMGEATFLSLPQTSPYLGRETFHCMIVPVEHLGSTLQATDDVVLWEEIRNFKKCLHRLAASLGGEAIFLETFLLSSKDEKSAGEGFDREISFKPSSISCQQPQPHPESSPALATPGRRVTSKRHAIIHALVIPRDRPDPQTFFRQLLEEADEEWHQHQRILETGPKGGLRRTIPAGNFSFVYVDFALDSGYVHVVENKRLMGEEFLLAAAADLLGLRWYERRRARANIQDARFFRQKYLPFDWTHLLQS